MNEFRQFGGKWFLALAIGFLAVVVCLLAAGGGYWLLARRQPTPAPVQTAVPVFTPTPFPETPTPPFTPTPYFTLTPFVTPTSQAAAYSVEVEKRSDGRYILVTSAETGQTLSYGPLAAGALVEGPNEKFCAYVDILGNVYVVTYGQPSLHRLDTNLKRDYQLQALMHGVEPEYLLSIDMTDRGTYVLIIKELSFGDKIGVELPQKFTLP